MVYQICCTKTETFSKNYMDFLKISLVHIYVRNASVEIIAFINVGMK
jgi:hypothetical protein